MKTKVKRSYIEEGEFDQNGKLQIGRLIFDDGSYEFVGDNIDKEKWENYLNTFNNETW